MYDVLPAAAPCGLTKITMAAAARTTSLSKLSKAVHGLRSKPDLLLTRLAYLRSHPDRLDEIAARSYLHSNGFAKVRLFEGHGLSLRLHIWPRGENRVGEVGPHGHRWEFASWVAVGQGMAETYFTEVGPNTPDAVRYDAYDYGRDVMGTGYLKDAGETWLRAAAPRVRRPGTVYRCPRDVLHTVAPVGDALVATVVLQGPVVAESARVCRLPGQPIDTDERTIRVGELDALFGEVDAAVSARGRRWYSVPWR